MEDIDKVVLDKLGGHSEEPPAGLFESVMFQREKEQSSLKTKRILLITGAAVLLAITAYVLYKTVYAALLPEQILQPVAQNNSPGIHSDITRDITNEHTAVWPDYRMTADVATSYTSIAANVEFYFSSANPSNSNVNSVSQNLLHSSKSNPARSLKSQPVQVTEALKTHSEQEGKREQDHSRFIRAYFTYQLNQSGEVSFLNESDAGKTATYTWHFGDGTSYEGTHAQHEFTKNGMYHTCLTVTDQQGKFDNYCTDLYIENLPEKRDIKGEVNLKNSVPDRAWVYLIRFDSLLMAPFLIDSIRTDETGHFVFQNIPEGYYILRAALDIKSKHYREYLPTFYGQTLGWNMASRYSINKESPLFNTVYIDLIHLQQPGTGSAMIEGNSPGENELLILYDERGNPVSFTYADRHGNFNFNNLPPGKYNVYNPLTGKFTSYTSYGPTPPSNQPTQPSANTPDGNSDNGNGGSISITTKDFTISPNPCRTYTTVKFDNPELSRARVSVININTNAEVYAFTVKNPQVKQEISIDVQYWAPGLYLITIDKGNGNMMSNKLLKSE